MCFCGSILCVFNLKRIYSIILTFVEMIATFIAHKSKSGNLLILKTFKLTAILLHLFWVSLW